MSVPITFPISVAFHVSPRGLIISPKNLVGVTSAISQVSVMTRLSFKRTHITTGVTTKSTVAARIMHDSAPLGTCQNGYQVLFM